MNEPKRKGLGLGLGKDKNRGSVDFFSHFRTLRGRFRALEEK